MENWQLFHDSRFDIQFQYPQISRDGEDVALVETQSGGLIRVHVLSPASREVYFEVSRYEAISASAEYQRHGEILSEKFDPLSMTALQETACASLPAYEYTFEWSVGTRTVILVELKSVTYCILFNPRSPVNLQILSTVEWLDLT